MSLPYGLLGLLTYQESTGYEITKIFEDSLNNFWHAQSSQIYRELDRLEQKGWVKSRSVAQDKRPNKRVYTITESGRAAFDEWLGEGTPQFEHSHEPFLVRLFFGSDAPEVTLALLKACHEMCLSALESFPPKLRENIDRYAAEVPDGNRRRMYWEMTLDYGIAQTRATMEWAQKCIEKLEDENFEYSSSMRP